MMSENHGRPSRFGRLQEGLSLIEFAIVAGVLVILSVAATDYSLAILARQEIHSAARSGMEFAINQGYNVNGIREAVRNPRGPNSPGLKLATIESIFPDADQKGVICACYADFSSGGGSGDPNWSATPPACNGSCPPRAEKDLEIAQSPYVTITVTGTYSPFFTAYWTNLQNGKVRLSATYVAKTYFKTW